ncbi:hypothetical protein A6B34_09800 [Mycolicibacterium monacense]|nr:hypothetical protein A6B34_09800 [Mycolicibacterium monacense]
MQRTAPQALRQGRSGVQGQRLLPHRQPRVHEDVEQRLGQELFGVDELFGEVQLVVERFLVECVVECFVEFFVEFRAGRGRLQLIRELSTGPR